MMQPGQALYRPIVERFGETVLAPDGALDRRVLAKLAFGQGRVEELNAIVHPAVLAEQSRLLAKLASTEPDAVAIVESALIFTGRQGDSDQPWRQRFDRIVLVRAPLEAKVARFVARMSAGRPPEAAEQSALEQDARARLSLQSESNDAHAAECLVLENSGELDGLREQVNAVWRLLRRAEPATG